MVEDQIPLTIEDASTRLRAGTISSVNLVKALQRRADRIDGRLGSYLTRFDETAIATAEMMDLERAEGKDRGPLHGIPLGVKDIIAAKEGRTTAQSLVLDPAWGEGKDAPVVDRLRAAGAVIMGKLTTMEYAIGAPEADKPFPVPCNPWNEACWPGGSSSGTANGIAGGLFLGGLGTDTGGSVRIPSALCGVSGLIPTYGLVPKSGVVPLGFSLDRIGPMARSAWDCAAMLTAMAGYDSSDETSAERPAADYLQGIDQTLDNMTIGVVRSPLLDVAAPQVRETYEAALATFERLGARTREVTLPLYNELSSALMVTMATEALAYHRNDFAKRWTDYTHGTRETVGWAAFMSGADYVQAQRVRRVGQRRIRALFEEVDLIICPTSTAGAPSFDAMLGEMRMESMAHFHTTYWSALGTPTLAVPIGFDASGLPLGIQITGRPFDEARILRAGYAYQGETDWHRRIAPMLSSN